MCTWAPQLPTKVSISCRGNPEKLRQRALRTQLQTSPKNQLKLLKKDCPAKGVGRVKSAAEVQILSSAPEKSLLSMDKRDFLHHLNRRHSGSALLK